MNELTKFLVNSILNEDEDAMGTVALFGGGFKPPTKGHLDVVLQGLKEYPEIKQVYILVGSGVRNNISQEESVKIWEMYQQFIPVASQIIPVSSPFTWIKTYLTDHKDEKVYIFIGARPGNVEDEKDVTQRQAFAKKYSDKVLPVKIQTGGGISGTKARAAAKVSKEEFFKYIPSKLSNSEKEQIFSYIQSVVTEKVEEDGETITCDNCGWSWGYAEGGDNFNVCHKCGHDNSPGSYVNLTEDLSFEKKRALVKKIITLARKKGDFVSLDKLADIIAKQIEVNSPRLSPGEFKVVKENATYSSSIDIMEKCAQLTNYMKELGMPIEPFPAVEFIDGDTENAKDFFGKTAYYDPNEQKIVLYTEGRHPKDIVRSFAHEMIHHMQNLDGRLGDITTTNTQEDDHLNDIEAEANLKGTMTFRNWTDSLQEGLYDDTKNFDLVKQNPFDIKKLADKGIVFITKPGDGKGGVADPNWEGDASVLTLYNMDKAEPWMEVAVKNLMPQAIQYIQKDQDKLIYNGKYRQILWGIDKKGLNPKDFYLHENKDPFGLLDGLLNEGVYDSIVSKLAKDVTDTWVMQFKEDPKRLFALLDTNYELEDAKGRPLEFDLLAKLDFKKTKDRTYKVDGGANEGDDESEGFIALNFQVDPRELPRMWSTIAMDIRDVLRHEIEHLTQGGWNVRQDKQMEDDQFIRDLIQKYKTLAPKNYFMLDKEVDAMLQGMYFKAKKARRPFADVIDDYLDMVGLEPEEKEEIKTRWRGRLKALSLPVFETKYRLKKVMNEQEGEQKYKIYCDMDGVICDFDKRFEQVSGGISPRQYEDQNGKEAFWDLIDNQTGVKFWVGMPWMPNGKQLWDYIKKYTPTLLSAPSRQNESRLGKRLWVRINIPGTKLILASAQNKQNYSGTNRILIDDRPSNIEQWKSAGGIGILFISTEQTIKELQKLGL